MNVEKGFILLLERDGEAAQTVQKALTGAGFSVTLLHECASAIEVLKDGTYSVLIADVLMTRSTDRDVIVWARRNVPHVRIVIMSEFDSSFLEKQCLNKGADLFLGKPVDLDRLLNFIWQDETSGSFSGLVQGIDLIEYVQFLMFSGKKIVLEIAEHQGARGEIFLDGGSVVHAWCGLSRGEEALYRCLSLRGGRVCNTPWRDPEEVSIGKPGDLLLMEAARKRDEAAVARRDGWATGAHRSRGTAGEETRPVT